MKKADEKPPEPQLGLQTMAPLPVTNPAPPMPSVAAMLMAVIEKGVTQENVAALERLTELYERMQDRDAQKEFATAFVELQAEMKGVTAKKIVPDKSGGTKYKYAPYEEIMEQVLPLLKKHGFTVTFSTDFKEGRVLKTCILQHVGGHTRSNTFAVRVGGGPPGASETQADGAANTYAKRGALCDALNIIIEHDDDARNEGAPITKAQAEDLKRRVRESASDEAGFLKFAGVATFEEIPSTKYAVLDDALRRKEKTR